MPPHPDDLNDVEARLAACAPARAGLDADAMLFAAGRASVRPGPMRFVWPGLTATLAALVVVLGVRLSDERDQRLALVERLRSAPPAVRSDAVAPPASAADDHADGAPVLLAVHRAVAEGRDPWPANVDTPAETPGVPEYVPVLQPRGLELLLGP